MATCVFALGDVSVTLGSQSVVRSTVKALINDISFAVDLNISENVSVERRLNLASRFKHPQEMMRKSAREELVPLLQFSWRLLMFSSEFWFW